MNVKHLKSGDIFLIFTKITGIYKLYNITGIKLGKPTVISDVPVVKIEHYNGQLKPRRNQNYLTKMSVPHRTCIKSRGIETHYES